MSVPETPKDFIKKQYPYKVSVVLPLWNITGKGPAGTTCFNLLELSKMAVYTIMEDPRGIELVVVDNASEQPTKDWLKELQKIYKERLVVVTNETNLGVAKGWNQGMRAASGEYIAIVNNDTLISQGWIDLLKHFDLPEKVGAVSPAELTGWNRKWPDLEQLEDPPLVINRAEMFSSDARLWVPFAKEYTTKFNGRLTWDWGFHGSWFIVCREMVQDVGLLDEAFVGGMHEDTDWILRIRDNKWRFIVDHSHVYYHYCEQSMNIQQRTGCIAKNKRYLDAKWKGRKF